MRKKQVVLLCAAMVSSVLHAAYLVEVDTDGLDNGILVFSPDFSFGGDTTEAGQSLAGTAVGLSGGDSIFGGNGSAYLDAYVYTYEPDVQADNLFLDPGTPLGDGNYASGAISGGPGRYAVYVTWPTSSNIGGGLTTYQVDTAGDTVSMSVNQNEIGNVWVKVGEVDYVSGPITVMQTPASNSYVSMRAAGALFERLPDTPGGGYTGPPGPVIFGQGLSRTFGVSFVRNRAKAQTNHFAVLQGTSLTNWNSSDLKLYSITDLDAHNELVTFRLMDPMAGIGEQFLNVWVVPKMPTVAPYVAMTYDDGPHPVNTPILLDLLAERNIRATFYVVGSNAQKYPHILRRMLNEGHEIGNHSMNHPHLTTLTDEEVIAEVIGCRDAVVGAATLPTATIRPPYGDVNQHLRDLFLSEFGYPTVMWDIAPADYNLEVPDEVIVHTITNDSVHGDTILAHDIHDRTISVMPVILDGLLARGFSFVTVTELLELQGD